MVGNARPERVVHGICHAMLDRQFVTLGQSFETRDAGVTVPGPRRKGSRWLMRSGMPSRCTRGLSPMLPDRMRTKEPGSSR